MAKVYVSNPFSLISGGSIPLSSFHIFININNNLGGIIMKELFYREIMKLNPDFKKIDEKERSNNLTIFGHKYISLWITYKFMDSLIPLLVCMFILGVDLTILMVFETKAITYTIYCLTIPLITLILTVKIIIRYKIEREKQDARETASWLWDTLQNLWLLNGKVISRRSWSSIKTNNKELYKWLRTNECNQKCYDATFQISKTLNDSDINILWIAITTCYGEKCGHAVLEKDGWIYDSNHRRTYKKEKYFQAQKAELYKEFPLEVYNASYDFEQLGWIEFGEWCNRRGAIRNF